MLTIRDNSEYEGTGYSGVVYRDFVYKGVGFDITKGWSGNYDIARIRVYAIHVGPPHHYDWFVLYAHDGGTTYAMLDLQPQAPEEQIANMVCATACQHINTFQLLSTIFRTSTNEGKRQGSREVQDAIKQALGLEE